MSEACIAYGEERRKLGFGVETWGERYHLKHPDLDGRIILRWIFRKWNVGLWTRSSWLRIGAVGGHLFVQ